MDLRLRVLPILLAIGLTAALPGAAQVMKEPNDSLDALAFSSDKLRVENVSEPLEDAVDARRRGEQRLARLPCRPWR